MDTTVNCNRLNNILSHFCKFVAIEIQLFKSGFNCQLQQALIDIETDTDKNAIGRVKHHKARAARADNGPVVYKKVVEIAKTC